jgi:CRISPR-associated protein Csm2
MALSTKGKLNMTFYPKYTNAPMRKQTGFNEPRYSGGQTSKAPQTAQTASRTPVEEMCPPFSLQQPTKELFDTTADQCAKSLKKSDSNKPTQLRRFYDELLVWHDRILESEDAEKAFQEYLPFIYMIKAKAAYAVGRKNIDENFRDFMNKLIAQITNIQTLKTAKLFMEAVMGFCKLYATLKGEKR